MGTSDNPGRALLGFMPEPEALGFLRSHASLDAASDEELRRICERARTAVAVLPAATLAPDIRELQHSDLAGLDDTTNSQEFLETVRNNPWSLKLVEIDNLICFQKFLNTEYRGPTLTPAEFSVVAKLVEFSLPRRPVARTVASIYNETEKSYTIFAPGQDYRVIGPNQSRDPTTQRRGLGFWVGWGSRFVQVVRFRDRYILRNGYHRVYEMRKNGATHVPCVLLEAMTYEDTGAAKAGFFAQEVVMSDQPPRFAHFFSSEIAPEIQLRAVTKILRIRAEEFIVMAEAQLPVAREDSRTPVPEQRTPQEGSHLDFKVTNEDWNVYRLADGTVMKLRQILLSIREFPTADDEEVGNFEIRPSPVLMVVIPPKHLMGFPSKALYTVPELGESIVDRDIKFKVVQETANTYATGSGRSLSIILQLQKVSRTNKFDADGNPVYVVNTNVMVGAKEIPE